MKSRIRFYENYAEFEISMAQITQADTTSTDDNKFEVVSYPTATYQFAILNKQYNFSFLTSIFLITYGFFLVILKY